QFCFDHDIPPHSHSWGSNSLIWFIRHQASLMDNGNHHAQTSSRISLLRRCNARRSVRPFPKYVNTLDTMFDQRAVTYTCHRASSFLIEQNRWILHRSPPTFNAVVPPAFSISIHSASGRVKCVRVNTVTGPDSACGM